MKEKMQKSSWSAGTVVVWGEPWMEADLDGTQRLMLIFMSHYVDERESSFVFEMPELNKRFHEHTDIITRAPNVLGALADKGYLYWKSFRYLGQEWHSVTITPKGRELCVG